MPEVFVIEVIVYDSSEDLLQHKFVADQIILLLAGVVVILQLSQQLLFAHFYLPVSELQVVLHLPCLHKFIQNLRLHLTLVILQVQLHHPTKAGPLDLPYFHLQAQLLQVVGEYFVG